MVTWDLHAEECLRTLAIQTGEVGQMSSKTIRLIPGAIARGLVPRLHLLWLPVDDSADEGTTESAFQIRVRICDPARESHAGNGDAEASCDSTVASCIAGAAP